MEAIVERVAGLDVHKKTVAVCVRIQSGKAETFRRTFGTTTRELLVLSDWLGEHGVTEVAMESTGVLWKPIWNILEGRFRVLLCNAQHIKKVPGRKTDVSDSEWIAQLLQHGLLTGSFVPDRPQRELRDLTRHRAQLVSERARQANRIHKMFEDANIKLATVASDILGASGRAMIEAMIGGQEDPKALTDLAKGRLRAKGPELMEALEGHVTEHHRFLLKMHYEHIQYLERLIATLDERIALLTGSGELDDEGARSLSETEGEEGEDGLPPLPFAEAVDLIDEIKGLDVRSAENILAETGVDMSRFASAKHLTSWARICPGNDQSAGKRKSGRTGTGNRWLKRALTEAAWAASHTKDTYLAAQYQRIVKRRGKKRAIVAVAHTILVILYHMLKYRRHFHELGGDFFDRLDPERVKRYHVRRLESLGFVVSLEKAEAA